MPVRHEVHPTDQLKESTIVALKRVIDPLIDLMFDAGITVPEINKVVRARAVQRAATRIAKENGRRSNSRIAIITGLARSEVARLFNAVDAASNARQGQHPARRVLAAWYENRRFLAANGDPAILPIFGKRRSFEQLVAMHSGGIPVRAMLDELAQIDAIEILSGQRVKAMSRLPILSGMSSRAIAMLGERTGDLLDTLTKNLQAIDKPLFEGTALMMDVEVDAVPLVRRQIAEQGAAFIDGANSLFARSRAKPSQSAIKDPPKCRVGVTVYYFQDEIASREGRQAPPERSRRKNLRRRGNSKKKDKNYAQVVTRTRL
jgi:Family of unknown function (DUF6502)